MFGTQRQNKEKNNSEYTIMLKNEPICEIQKEENSFILKSLYNAEKFPIKIFKEDKEEDVENNLNKFFRAHSPSKSMIWAGLARIFYLCHKC